MKILISAAEASSDAHAAQLLKALRQRDPDLDVFGIGGPALQSVGFRTTVDTRDLQVMGVVEVVSKIPKIISSLLKLLSTVAKEKPDVAVVMDFPDFHFILTPWLRWLGVPVIYYIPPKVWAWRRYRIRKLKMLFEKLITIFPFEVGFYHRQGISATYVGNPLMDELPMRTTRAEARTLLGLGSEEKVMALLPGSRPKEFEKHFRLILDSALNVAKQMKDVKLKAIMPIAATANFDQWYREFEDWQEENAGDLDHLALDFEIFQGQAHLCLLASDVGIVKSGTSTLEAGLLGCRHVIFYRASWVAEFLFKWVFRYRDPVGLVNLVHGWKSKEPFVFREFVCNQATVENISAEVISLLTNLDRQIELDIAIQKVKDAVFHSNQSPSELAAQEVMSFVQASRLRVACPSNPKDLIITKLFRATLSHVWSLINFTMRRLSRRGWIQSQSLDATVFSIGNIQAGGAGKTPLTAYVAQELLEGSRNVCILTRGYKSEWEERGGVISPFQKEIDPKKVGDEAALLHSLVPGAWIGVGQNRFAQFKKVQALAREKGLKIDVVLLDDGFQNWKIKKDFEIVAVTSANWGDCFFRDWRSELKNADLVIWTKGKVKPKVPYSQPIIQTDFYFDSKPPPLPLWLVTGVADGESVRDVLQKQGYEVKKHSLFPDHMAYEATQINKILNEAKSKGLHLVLTGKDWVKWEKYCSDIEVSVLEPRVELNPEGVEVWSKMLQKDSAWL